MVNVNFGVADVINAADKFPRPAYKIIGLVGVLALFYLALSRVPEGLVIWTLVGEAPSYLILVIACAIIDLRKKGK